MILVTGATGHFGKTAIETLLAKGVKPAEIAALVRNEAKASELSTKGIQLRIGDYDDYPSLVKAFTGINKLLLVSGSDIANRSQQQANAVRAAKEAGVKYILYTSFERKNNSDSSPIAAVAKAHIETEQAIKASGIPYTIFRNNLYMDFIPMFIGKTAPDNGIHIPAGDTRFTSALRSDMAEAAANVLLTDGHEGKEYTIANTKSFSFNDVAETIGKVKGKTVLYSPSSEEYNKQLTNEGLPAEYIGMFSAFGESIRQGEFETGKTDLPALLGRQPVTLDEFLEKTYS